MPMTRMVARSLCASLVSVTSETLRYQAGQTRLHSRLHHPPQELTCLSLLRTEEGKGNLTEAGDDEFDTVDQVPGNTLDSRLACVAIVTGDVTVSIPNWNRNAVSEHG